MARSTKPQVFISYSGQDGFEASLLQYAVETILAEFEVQAWTFQRDQRRSEKQIAKMLKQRVGDSNATIFLVSRATIAGGATQWMELAYADAFEVPTFVLLHQLTFQELKASDRNVPPLLVSSQCNLASDWRRIVDDIRRLVKRGRNR